MRITTLKEQAETAVAAKKVGGYGELVRLSHELAQKPGGKLHKNSDGTWSIIAPDR